MGIMGQESYMAGNRAARQREPGWGLWAVERGVDSLPDTGQVAVKSLLFHGWDTDLLTFKAVLGKRIQAQVAIRRQNVLPTQSTAEMHSLALGAH